MPNRSEKEVVAAAMLLSHGLSARQLVVDRLVAAIRDHDLPTAHYWNDVGEVIDRSLIAA